MSDEVKTAEEIAQDYTAMGHSVDLINGIIDGSLMADDTQEDKNDDNQNKPGVYRVKSF